MKYLTAITNTHLQRAADISAVTLAFLCTLHCLVLPLFIIVGSMLGSLALADESFHKTLVFITLPISMTGLYLGCRKHQRLSVILTGAVGVSIIVLAACADAIFHSPLLHTLPLHMSLPHTALIEKTLSVLGSLLIIFAHIKNHRLCRQQNCSCSSH
ncbi:MerC domain-containing protein [Marinagarivorans algicola]|uniref:MerC domain-containing protein n=1 Tax=Marinagarivorans algicola TaxID=1513270 RepID=UPI0037366B2F